MASKTSVLTTTPEWITTSGIMNLGTITQGQPHIGAIIPLPTTHLGQLPPATIVLVGQLPLCPYH